MQDDFAMKMKRTVGFDGLISTLIGAFIVFWPGASVKLLASIIGVALLILGGVKLLFALNGSETKKSTKLYDVLVAILYLVAGLFVFIDMEAASFSLLLVVGVLTGITWLVEGIIQIVVVNRLGGNHVWHFISALISALAGMSLIFSPFVGGLLVWMFLGVMLLIVGIFKLVHYFTIGK
ncbi:HdeD family acid-resistance protein [Fructobacillus ficulneus]|uniref:Integral membrane protein n=1 Tax=Fructobacillus ficulneus TaxID=157463 RepID=A0A0K8MH67_9LACO|nr:DUF308 domain-containing protein [Fructobacillus ficulneus]GAO99812.1 integral membrane protein [Fructobacillus ficulneus]